MQHRGERSASEITVRGGFIVAHKTYILSALKARTPDRLLRHVTKWLRVVAL